MLADEFYLFFLTSLLGFFSWTGLSRIAAWAFLYISSILKKKKKFNFPQRSSCVRSYTKSKVPLPERALETGFITTQLVIL